MKNDEKNMRVFEADQTVNSLFLEKKPKTRKSTIKNNAKRDSLIH